MERSLQKIGTGPITYVNFFIEHGVALPSNFLQRAEKFEEFSRNDPEFAFKFAIVFMGELYVPWLSAHHNEPKRFNNVAADFFYKCAQLLDLPEEIVESKEKLDDNFQQATDAALWMKNLLLLYWEAKNKNTGCLIS